MAVGVVSIAHADPGPAASIELVIRDSSAPDDRIHPMYTPGSVLRVGAIVRDAAGNLTTSGCTPQFGLRPGDDSKARIERDTGALMFVAVGAFQVIAYCKEDSKITSAGKPPLGFETSAGRFARATVERAKPIEPSPPAPPSFWVYEMTIDGKPYATMVEWEAAIESFDGSEPSFVLEDFMMRDKARDHQRSYFATRGDGVYLLGRVSDVEDTKLLEVGTLNEGGELAVPMPFQPGTKGKIKTVTSTIANGHAGARSEITGEIEVGAVQTVIVPAGTFQCTQVKTTKTAKLDLGAAGHTVTMSTENACYATNVGLVKLAITSETTTHIKNVPPSKAKSVAIVTLAKHRVTKPSPLMQAIGHVSKGAP